MLKILQICSSLEGTGGVQSMIKNYYSHMNEEMFRFDFIVHGDAKGEMEAWFEERGSQIFHVPPRRVSFCKNIQGIARVLKKGNYDIVHCHQDYHGAMSLAMAKFYGVNVRIAHCHQAYPPENILQKTRRAANTALLKSVATDFWACGIKAAEWCYGKGCVDNGSAMVLRNAIEVEKYKYSDEKRTELRKYLGVENMTVVGHVGRFTDQKNHRLLLDIFQKLHQKNPESVLLLVGDGPLKESVSVCVQQMGLEKNVLMLGARDDVPNLLNAFDIFVLPSRFEGLCIVAIEAQANSLPIICSQNVTDEVRISDNVSFMPFSQYDNPSAWCDAICQVLEKGRSDSYEAVRRAGYSIFDEANKLERKYMECCKRERDSFITKSRVGGGVEFYTFCPRWKTVEEYSLS